MARARGPAPAPRDAFFEVYTRGLSSEEIQRLFLRDARDAYRFFSQTVDRTALDGLPWHRRRLTQIRLLFLAFTLRLSPARRVVYGVALVFALVGLAQQFVGIGAMRIPLGAAELPLPVLVFREGALWFLSGFVLLNLLVLLEVFDRLSLKNDLEIAREIQSAMLPSGTLRLPTVEVHGVTQPANTVGGDFYDILPMPDGRLVIAVGDVAGKGSPAALLMALLLAMLRTLLDEHLDLPELVTRLNRQIARHAPPSRFITLFLGFYEPKTRLLRYANAGHIPPLVRRASGQYTRLDKGGIALGMFEEALYGAADVRLEAGDTLLLYSDGITEAESPDGRFFDESGLEEAVGAAGHDDAQALCAGVIAAVGRHAGDSRFADDLTILVLRVLKDEAAAGDARERRSHSAIPGV